MCGHWHRSSGSPAKSGARSASAVYVSNPTVYGPKSSKWPSYPSSATDSDAVFVDALGIGSPFAPGGPYALDDALVDEELTDGVEISAVDHARVVLAHDLLVLL